MSSTQDHRIDVQSLLKNMDQCVREDSSIDLTLYLEAYRALHRFFVLLGRIFGFVATDIESKIGILTRYLHSDHKQDYETIQKMMKYEKDNDLLRGKEPSGARTLLRLHWALEFILAFLSKVEDLEDHEKTCQSSQDAYKNTLGKHHPWLIQKAAMLAMHTLPTAEGLVQTTCIQPVAEVRQALPRIIEVGTTVYNITQKLYEDNGCLDLP